MLNSSTLRCRPFVPEDFPKVWILCPPEEDQHEITALLGIPHVPTCIVMSCYMSSKTVVVEDTATGLLLGVGGHDDIGDSLWFIPDRLLLRFPRFLLKEARKFLEDTRPVMGYNWVSDSNSRAKNFLLHLGADFSPDTTTVRGVVLRRFKLE